MGEEILPPFVEPPPLRRRPRTSGRGVAGTPGRVLGADTQWRDDLYRLMNLRIAGSQTQMVEDLGTELLATAKEVLTDKHPSWELFMEICPLEEGEGGDVGEGDEWQVAQQEGKADFVREEVIGEDMAVEAEEEMPEAGEETPEKEQEAKEVEGVTQKKGKKREVAF